MNQMINSRRRVGRAALGITAAIAVGASALGVATIGDTNVTGAARPAAAVASPPQSPDTATESLPPRAKQAFRNLLAKSGGAERLQAQLRSHLGAHKAGINADDGDAIQALEYGVDGDHVWIKVTVSDIANGALSTLCGRLGPAAPACKILVDTIIRWYENNNASHGVWGEIYASGQIRVGSW